MKMPVNQKSYADRQPDPSWAKEIKVAIGVVALAIVALVGLIELGWIP